MTAALQRLERLDRVVALAPVSVPTARRASA